MERKPNIAKLHQWMICLHVHSDGPRLKPGRISTPEGRRRGPPNRLKGPQESKTRNNTGQKVLWTVAVQGQVIVSMMFHVLLFLVASCTAIAGKTDIYYITIVYY